MGLLTDQEPPAWHPADDEVKKQCKNSVEYCRNYGSKIVKLAVWFSMQCKDIDTHLIGMMNVKEVESNLATLHDGITDEEKELLNEIQNKYSVFLSFENFKKTINRKFFKASSSHIIVEDINYCFFYFRYLSNIKGRHWENKELTVYWKNIKK